MPGKQEAETDAQTLEQKAGRLLFIGLPVTKLDRYTREMLREVQPGGVILFGRNIESAAQVGLLNAQIRDAVGRKVVIGVDQEGGLVDRFRHICEPMPAAKSVRNAGSSELAEKFGALTARLLRMLGFNMDFAPVLDLGGDNDDNGLRGRTFGTHPAQVSRLAGAFLDGLQRGGIVGCGKHFPGLGGSTVDSHRRLPVVQHTWEEILEHDLQPFMDLMFHRHGERLHALMVSHAAFPDVSEFLQEVFRRTRELPSPEELNLPATISGNVVMRLMRQMLKFDGLVITDDMEMGAVVQTLSVPEASLRAIEAGSDMVLICEQEANFKAARDQLVEAVNEGRIDVGFLERAGRRIDAALAVAPPYEPLFSEEEFATLSSEIAKLKLELRVAEETGEYTPLYGTEEGDVRRTSNF